MNKVLYIKANANLDELSRTYRISDAFIDKYKSLHPQDQITTLDLYEEGITFLPKGSLEEIHNPKTDADRGHPILKYTYQFLENDKYVIAAPFWNLSIPAILKAYIDYIMVTGLTFKYTDSGAVGLCQGKKAIHITSRGGYYNIDPYAAYEMGDRYLRVIFGFLGITDFITVAANGTDIIGNDVEAIINDAVKEGYKAAEIF